MLNKEIKTLPQKYAYFHCHSHWLLIMTVYILIGYWSSGFGFVTINSKMLLFSEPSFEEKHCNLKQELFVSSWELTL